MAQFGRRRQRRWRFGDGGNRFDGKTRAPRTTGQPISPALKRGVRHCKRCGNRVISQADNCPYCGGSLLPFFLRLWFWLLVVLAVAGVVFFAVFRFAPSPTTEITHPEQPNAPLVVGAEAGTPIKDLKIGTKIDVDGLEVTVTGFEDEGLLDRNEKPLQVLTVEFVNKRKQDATLYSTQWMAELADGTRIDTYIGSTIEGTPITGNFESYELPAGGSFKGRLYFECEAAALIIYQPTPLAFDEELLVTWSTADQKKSDKNSDN
ncbi:MAG: hypothetical protein FWG00_00635 [Coriobacteriia bacterium]|nr:hypothetical protein [Coriobacteriia bacterium]MDR2714910.1 hypothetical protein [Coriobacteriales bacterium]